MAKRGIHKLIESSGFRSSVRLTRQMPPKTAEAIELDLKAIVKAQADNWPVPTHPAIAKYIAETYAIAIQPTTISSWIAKLRQGGSIL